MSEKILTESIYSRQLPVFFFLFGLTYLKPLSRFWICLNFVPYIKHHLYDRPTVLAEKNDSWSTYLQDNFLFDGGNFSQMIQLMRWMRREFEGSSEYQWARCTLLQKLQLENIMLIFPSHKTSITSIKHTWELSKGKYHSLQQ